MEIEEFSNVFINVLKEIGLEINQEKVNKFYKYMNLLLEWNEKMNLTAITDYEEIIIKHFIDSLTIEQEIKENSQVVDVGTGAGFPGIPLKIFRDDIKITLVDSLNKRLIFLDTVVKELELNNVDIIHMRAEEIGRNKKYREKFDVVTSRAVANLATLSEYMIPLVKENGLAICMKGSKIEEEVEGAKKAIKVLGGKILKIKEFKLPKISDSRSILVLRKIESTPMKFPRKAGIPSKDPIK